MSTNLHLSASRAITVNSIGKTDIQYTHYDDLWQTPTRVTNAIVLSDNPKQAYKGYVMSITKDHNEPVYAEDDLFCEVPVGTVVVHNGKNECTKLDAWIACVEDQGYVIKFDAW